MKIKNALCIASAAALTVAPVAAQAAGVARDSAPARESSDIAGAGLIVAILAAIAVIIGIIIAADGDDAPVSP